MAVFSVGSLVRFKSGGPSMVVVGCADNEWIDCMWFNQAEDVWTIGRQAFPPAVLVND